MRQSNIYIIFFTLFTAVFVGGTLAFTSIMLGPRQKRAIEIDTKSQILGAVMKVDDIDVMKIYDERIVGLTVNSTGNEITSDEKGQMLLAENVSIAKNYKKDREDRQLPVFKYVKKSDREKVEAYIIPVYGNGLWDRIWGFIALDETLETVQGVSFGHKQETPGLGARIADDPVIAARYKGKKIYDKEGHIASVYMIKGEQGKSLDEHHVDGMSGATMTAKGVNQMLQEYLDCYKPYFDKIRLNETSDSYH